MALDRLSDTRSGCVTRCTETTGGMVPTRSPRDHSLMRVGGGCPPRLLLSFSYMAATATCALGCRTTPQRHTAHGPIDVSPEGNGETRAASLFQGTCPQASRIRTGYPHAAPPTRGISYTAPGYTYRSPGEPANRDRRPSYGHDGVW